MTKYSKNCLGNTDLAYLVRKSMGERTIPLRDITKMIKDYLQFIVDEVTENPVPFFFENPDLGHVQVLEHPSEKSYEWDRVYKSKDWTIIWKGYADTYVGFSHKYHEQIYKNALAGKKYLDKIVDPKELDKSLNLIRDFTGDNRHVETELRPPYKRGRPRKAVQWM